MRIKIISILLALAALLSLSYGRKVKSEHVRATLIPEVLSVKPGNGFLVALRLEMDDEWHTYWKNPGEAGLATSIEWDLPEDFTAGEIMWPYPDIIEAGGIVSYGYENDVYLLTEITAPQNITTDSIKIFADVSWLECKVACLPGSGRLGLTLPVNKAEIEINRDKSEIFSKAKSLLPISSGEYEHGASLTDSSVIVEIFPPEFFSYTHTEIRFYPYEESIFSASGNQELTETGRGYTLEIPLEGMRVKDPERITGILVSETGWRGPGSEKAMEIDIVPGADLPVSGSGNEEETGMSIWLALLFAFVGGIILNLMPCVLPVLSIKIMGFVNQAGNDKKEIVYHGLIFTAGVLVSFLALAGLLIALRAGGQQLGWGFQLQSPGFIVILSVFLFLFALNLFGVFEMGYGLMRKGNEISGTSGGRTGAFLTGVTATIVATPCTAPFMGSALGFTLTQPAIITLLIFTSLALGMAFPYLLLSIFPGWLKFIPKPGAWMEKLKQFMGFLLAATVIWLIWVLGFQAGSDGIVILLFILLITSVAAWIYGTWGTLQKSSVSRKVSLVSAVVMVIAAVWFGVPEITESARTATTNPNSVSGEGLKWNEYSSELVNRSIQQNKPVFIDFTAAWCLTCQVNKKVALTDKEVVTRFKEAGIVPVKADWTSRNEVITRALEKFGRNSVPLYVLYKPGIKEPEILPEVLTPGIVIDKIEDL